MTPSFARKPRATLVTRAVAASFPFALFIASAGAWAQSATSAQTIVVTANRTPQPLSSVLADISVIDRATIERSGAVGVADLLARLPGVEISRSGGPAATTSVFIRGAENRHTALYIDGVRVDSQSTGGAMWEQIPIDQIERIEVLRGPAAAIYGSDAVGGVVQLFTKRGNGAPKPTVAVTVGSFGTRQVSAGVSGSAQALDYSLSASHGRADGFDARTATVAHNRDEDGWRRNSVQGRVGFQLSPDHRVHASLLATNLRSQYDSSLTADDVSSHTLRTVTGGWQGKWSESATTRLDLGQTQTTYETQPSFYRTETTLRNYALQHEQRFGTQLLSATLERREDELLNPATQFASTLEGKRNQNAIGLGWRGDFGPFGLQAHVRRDDDSEFGDKNTGSLAWGWTFLPQWRITAAAATSFRAPTLYQRFSEYGNPTLVPESGRNVEFGLRWSASDSEASVTAWRNKVSNLIVFGAPGPCVDSFGCYENVGKAQLEGVTLAARTKVSIVTLRASLDWHDPRNTDTDKVLQRRARRLGTFGADTQWAGVNFGAEVQGAGERWENATNTQRLGGYALVNLYASTRLMAGLSLEGRVDNVGDKAYELARAYATPGRNAQLTLRWTLP